MKQGTYRAIVKDNVDKTGNGRIRVYIPAIGGNPDAEQSWYVVNYMSPHAGNTKANGNKKGGKEENDTQESYGTWMNGYHLENEVIVSFLDDDASSGVVMGGLFQQNMNHSMGGYGFSQTPDGEFEPTVEYNKRDEDIDPRAPERPRNERLWRQLQQQGLIGDPMRTTMNSSPQRDPVPQIVSIKSARGSSFVFDDGKMDASSGAGVNSRVYARQAAGGSGIIQMRTEGGAQTIINDDCGFIHMTSGNGNSTMQLSDNGVTYFSEGHIAIRVQGNFVRFVDGNATLETMGPTTYSVGGNTVYAVNGKFSHKDNGAGIFKQTGGEYTQKSATSSIVQDAGGAISYKAASIVKEAAAIHKNSVGSMAPTTSGPLQVGGVMSVKAEAAPSANTPVNEPVIRQAATIEDTTLPADGFATHDPAPANAQTCGGPADPAEETAPETQNTPDDKDVVRIIETGPGYNVVELADGTIERRDGSRNWRNNNPGNIEYGDYAKSQGAIGSDGRFAIFPDYESGRAAKENLLFNTSSYANTPRDGYPAGSIGAAISRYAPRSENNTAAYIGAVTRDLGVGPNTSLSSLTASQRQTMLNSMERVEGFKAGSVRNIR